MLKELIAIGMATTLITAPPQNTNDETYYQDVNITETYEYETNEVNSVDDLVVGNVYKYNFISNTQTDYDLNIYCSEIYIPNIMRLNDYDDMQIFYFNDYLHTSNHVLSILNGEIEYNYNIEFYFVYIYYETDGQDANYFINNVSASDYLGEKTTTVEPVETEGLYNLAYHFLYSRIYTNTELQGMETTLFGTTINMNMWLSHTTAIVIICLLLLILIKFVLWLFKIVSGGMLWQ